MGLQLRPHGAGLDAHRGRHLQGRAGTQAPPRLAPAPSDPQPRPPRGAGPAHCRQTPHTPGTGPSGIQSRRPWCPQVHCLDCHLPWGCSRVCAPEPHTPQGCGWHPALEAGPSPHPIMLGVLGRLGPELELHRSASPSPCHAPDSRQCRPCQASRGALGGQGGLEVPLSEMEKHY